MELPMTRGLSKDFATGKSPLRSRNHRLDSHSHPFGNRSHHLDSHSHPPGSRSHRPGSRTAALLVGLSEQKSPMD